MAGHSKWDNIKHRKGRQDILKSKQRGKYMNDIVVAIRNGGNNVEENPDLETAINRAKQGNVPRENIDRVVNKDLKKFQTVNMEVSAFGGIVMVVEVDTDNKSRTKTELHILTKNREASLAQGNTVLPRFDRKGLFRVDKSACEETLMDIALEGGADDVELMADNYLVSTSVQSYIQVKRALEASEMKSLVLHDLSEGLVWVPKFPHEDATPEQVQQSLALADELQEHEDVSAVHHNMHDDLLAAQDE